MQVHNLMAFYYSTVESTIKRVNSQIYSHFASVCDLGYQMAPKVKATKTSKIQPVLQDFPEGFMKNPSNELYCNLCSCTVSF